MDEHKTYECTSKEDHSDMDVIIPLLIVMGGDTMFFFLFVLQREAVLIT